MKTLSLWTLLLPISLLAAGEVQAQEKTVHHPLPAEMEIPLKYGADRLGKRQDDAMEKIPFQSLGLIPALGDLLYPWRILER